MLKWLLRIVLGLIAVIVLLVAGVLVAFSVWRAGFVRTLEAESEIAATPLGEIEYAVEGEGIPLLYVHGTPGGYEQGLADRRARPDAFADIQTIAVSRPGFLRTPLSSGETPAEQADLFAALLDEIGVERVVVVAVSGGGPPGLQFALRHPERTRGLVMIAPLVVRSDEEAQAPTTAVRAFVTDVGVWAVGERMAARYIPGFDVDDPEEAALVSAFVKSVVPVARRVDGWMNDFDQFHALDVDAWALEALPVPTLIVHGDADRNAPYEGSVAAAERIPNAELATFEGAGHEFVLTQAREIDAHVLPFIHGLGE